MCSFPHDQLLSNTKDALITQSVKAITNLTVDQRFSAANPAAVQAASTVKLVSADMSA